MKRFLSLIILTILLNGLSAQMTIESSQTVEDYVQNILIGQGVSVSNVTFNGLPGNMINLQCGFFESNASYMPIEEGLVLSTGHVLGVDFNGDSIIVGETISITVGNSSVSDDDLIALTDGDSISDQAIIEFDFIPQGDTLRFSYVFGSEEYPEFVNSFNDAFGFFLSGPGINGPYSSPSGFPNGSDNIALIPGTTTPVTIDNVNAGNFSCPGPSTGCTNCEFYVDNCDIEADALDGMTTMLEAFSIVQCGATYHIKLAIGDAGDAAYDSAVFLEAGSFQSAPTGITAESLFPLGLVEISSACDSGFARIGRSCAGDSIFYHINVLTNDSSATSGVDFEPLPEDLFMIPGQTELFFPIQTIPDGIVEDTEYICIELSESLYLDSTFTIIDTACVAIIDNYTFPVTVDSEVLWCPDHVPSLLATPASPAVAPFTYEWSQDGSTVLSTDNPYEAAIPAQWDSTYYVVSVTDFCGAVNDSAGAYVINSVPDYPEVDIVSDEYCPGIDLPLHCNRNGGTGPHTYIWTDDLGGTYADAQTINVDPVQLYGPIQQLTYKVVYQDNCTPTRTDSAEYTVVFPQPLTTAAFMSSAICTDQVLELSTTAAGGYPPYTYTWTSIPDLVPTQFFPIQYGFLQGAEGEAGASGFLVDELFNENSQYLIELELDDWCSLQSDLFFSALDADTVQALDCIYPNVVSPNGDGSNDSFIVNELINRPGTMFIYNRWGNLLGETNDNEWRISEEPEGTYFYVVQFDDDEADKERKGYFTIVR